MRGGKCVTSDGTLAGAHLTMLSAVENSIEMLGLDFARVVRMATPPPPAEFMALDRKIGKIEVGLDADFLIFDQDKNLKQVWVREEAVISHDR